MKKSKTKTKSKPKSAKKNRSQKPAVISQPITPALPTVDEIMARLAERNLEAVGKRIQDDLNFLPKAALLESSKSGLSDYESSVAMLWVIDSVVNRIVETLQTIEKQTPNPRLRKVVQDQMVYSARRFSDAAFAVVARTPKEASKIMTQSLVKFITGQCDNLKKACTDNPQTFQWIAEQNVFWPSVRSLSESYSDDFLDVKKKKQLLIGLKTKLNLAGGLPIDPKPKRAPDLNKAAAKEVMRFLIRIHASDATFTPAPQNSKGEREPTPWGKATALPALPPLTREPAALDLWKARLFLYLESHKQRLLLSTEFADVRKRQRVKGKNDNDALAWDEIKKDCFQVLRSFAPAESDSRNSQVIT